MNSKSLSFSEIQAQRQLWAAVKPSPDEPEYASLDFSKNAFILQSHVLPALPFLWQH